LFLGAAAEFLNLLDSGFEIGKVALELLELSVDFVFLQGVRS
jgi:hypothetical protein